MILASVSVINESENYEALLECAVILNGKLTWCGVARVEGGRLSHALWEAAELRPSGAVRCSCFGQKRSGGVSFPGLSRVVRLTQAAGERFRWCRCASRSSSLLCEQVSQGSHGSAGPVVRAY